MIMEKSLTSLPNLEIMKGIKTQQFVLDILLEVISQLEDSSLETLSQLEDTLLLEDIKSNLSLNILSTLDLFYYTTQCSQYFFNTSVFILLEIFLFCLRTET